jgi:stage V sporulation protein G
MDISINRMNKYNGQGTLKAFVDVCYGKVILKGFKVIQGQRGLFLSNPSEKAKDGKYYDTVFFIDASDKQMIEKLALEMYEKEV